MKGVDLTERVLEAEESLGFVVILGYPAPRRLSLSRDHLSMCPVAALLIRSW